jgi:hypothetical protein
MQERDETRAPFEELNAPIIRSAGAGWLGVVGRRWGRVTFVF